MAGVSGRHGEEHLVSAFCLLDDHRGDDGHHDAAEGAAAVVVKALVVRVVADPRCEKLSVVLPYEGFFVVLTTRNASNTSSLEVAIQEQGGETMIVKPDLVPHDSI